MSLSITRFPIFKISATGNDFLLIDLLSNERRTLWSAEFANVDRAELTRLWCDRHTGLGADGLVFLQADPQFDFAWDFYNSDGGNAEMCGNAARGVSLYVARTLNKSQLTFKTRAGQVKSWVHSIENIEVQLPAILDVNWGQSHSNINYDFVRAGVPHAVVQASDLNDHAHLKTQAAKVKSDPRFQVDGVNVTFVSPLSSQKIASVTFERGVEDFTRACGTGAVAAAYSVTHGEEQRSIAVQVPGGLLSVVWQEGRPHLSGPARIVAEMHVALEA